MDQELSSKIKLRLAWVKKYQELGNAGKVCDHFRISRLTLRKWLKRYDLSGIEGLNDLSSKPHNSPNQKLSEEQELIILDLRKNRKLGARRIQNELKRLHKLSFAVSTIHKALKRNNVPYLHFIAKLQNFIIAKFQVKEFRWMFAKLPRIYINIPQLMIVSDIK